MIMEMSCLHSSNSWFLEGLYQTYLENPVSLDKQWQEFFSRLQQPETPITVVTRQDPAKARNQQPGSSVEVHDAQKQVAVLQLINAYRFRGHRQADLDPLRQYERPEVADLDPAFHGLFEEDMEATFNTGSLCGTTEAKLREILAILRTTYCRTIGAEYMHITDTAQKRWIQQRLELNQAIPNFPPTKKRHILERLIAAGSLEGYLHTKYVGQKRFSLEGGESLIPLLDELIQRASTQSVKEVVIGMAHRGRLNVLVNTVGKRPAELFTEFEGKGGNGVGSGDVKYHLGFSSDLATPGGPIHVVLSFNPSHLEIIDPVVEGSVRARQDRRKDKTRNTVLPVLIHGDAAFAGQGVVMETLNLSQTRGYTTGGTVHIIINNQIGFTTSDPLDARSTLYCTDVAKMVQAPIFHVNGDDPEAVVFLAQLALDFRMEFHKDIVLDLVCYRKHGHSEADEPSVTQPIMYQRIRQHPGVQKLYADKLVQEGVSAPTEPLEMARSYVQALERNQAVAGPLVYDIKHEFRIDFSPFIGTHWREPAHTPLSLEKIAALTLRFTTLPEAFKLHRSVARIIEQRREMGRGQLPIDWGYAETLAYASLVDEDYPVRLSGQDSARGTFAHRHAVLYDQNTGDSYIPLQYIKEDQPSFLIINSLLSEEAVLGFEYGYSSSAPNALVIWEAQFGDFANNAQVVIDQFLTSSEAKWGRYCGLVLFLPHGYDGQGPEHSSARLERFLQLAAEENIQVSVPSTPAQMFHLLKRQLLRRYRKPLVVMTPKSLLRHKLSVSTLSDLTHSGFQMVIDEIDAIDPAAVERLLVCSGKVYFDLLEARRARKITDIAIVRIEQIYPFPVEEMDAVIAGYPNVMEVVWVQEEPRNQGAWVYLLARLHLFGRLRASQQLRVVARPYCASPAVGYMSKHLEQQQALVDEALRLSQAVARKQKTA